MKTDTLDPFQNTLTKIGNLAAYLLLAVLVLLPFHALLTVLASTLLGNYEYLRLWKEVLLLALMVPALVLLWRRPELWRQLRQGWLFWAMICYVLLHLGLGFAALLKGQVNSYALIYAWVINLRPLLIFVLAFIFAAQAPWLQRHWRQILLWPAALVVAFGLLQLTVLPADFLRNFGYSTATIEPFQTIDDKPDYVRIQSTLRGSNPLGAYLVLVLGAALVLLRRSRERHHLANWLLAITGTVVLVASYSRSAYVGLALTVVATALFAARSRRGRQWLLAGMVVFALVVAGSFVALRNNDRFENTFFHTNEHSQSAVSSNEQRWLVMEDGLKDIAGEPFGRGPGTAGPASAHNLRPARIAENYYLQIGQEVGWLGLGLFLAILVMVTRRLWQLRSQPLARVLLVSLAGICFINLVQHAWTDDTLALLWWGLAGLALAPAITKSKPSSKAAKQP